MDIYNEPISLTHD